MKEYVIRLTPRSGFEIMLHSDTLFGAICWSIRTLFGEEKLLSVLEEFKISPPFFLSSAFPWKKVGSRINYYLPRPVLAPLNTADFEQFIEKAQEKKESYHTDKLKKIEIVGRYKQFKKLKWIPLPVFKKILKDPSEKVLFIDYLDNLIKEPRFTTSAIAQKNSLDRLSNSTTGAGETFYTPDISFRANHGLYFLLRTAYMDEYLRPVLKLLEDSGIGPNARTGRNWFNIEVEETPLFEGGGGKTFITLSRYIGIDSIDVNGSYYQLESVRSKVESRQEFAGEDAWKERVMYFTAGSVLKPMERKEYYGGLVPVKEIAGKTIYQYGYAYPVWIGDGGEYGI